MVGFGVAGEQAINGHMETLTVQGDSGATEHTVRIGRTQQNKWLLSFSEAGSHRYIVEAHSGEPFTAAEKAKLGLINAVRSVTAVPNDLSVGDRIRPTQDIDYVRPIVIHVGQGQGYRGYFDSNHPTPDIGSLSPVDHDIGAAFVADGTYFTCLLYTSPSPRD